MIFPFFQVLNMFDNQSPFIKFKKSLGSRGLPNQLRGNFQRFGFGQEVENPLFTLINYIFVIIPELARIFLKQSRVMEDPSSAGMLFSL